MRLCLRSEMYVIYIACRGVDVVSDVVRMLYMNLLLSGLDPFENPNRWQLHMCISCTVDSARQFNGTERNEITTFRHSVIPPNYSLGYSNRKKSFHVDYVQSWRFEKKEIIPCCLHSPNMHTWK